MTNGAHHIFTYGNFALTVIRVIGVCILIFIAVMTLAYLYFEAGSDRAFDANLSLAIPAMLYLSFILGWAIAYSKYFRFPKNQKVLLLGVGIGALIVPALAGPVRLSTGEMNFSELVLTVVPGYLLGGLLGAALQMYFLAIALRYLIRFKLPF